MLEPRKFRQLSAVNMSLRMRKKVELTRPDFAVCKLATRFVVSTHVRVFGIFNTFLDTYISSKEVYGIEGRPVAFTKIFKGTRSAVTFVSMPVFWTGQKAPPKKKLQKSTWTKSHLVQFTGTFFTAQWSNITIIYISNELW